MSIRALHTFVIVCDFCDEAFSDVVELSAATLEACAKNHGWASNDSHQIHTCPKCLERQRHEGTRAGNTNDGAWENQKARTPDGPGVKAVS